MSVNVAIFPKFQAFDDDGHPLAGGKLYSYQAGTVTPLATYLDSTGLTANANPVILDSAGRADVWLLSDRAYKLELDDANDTLVWFVDGLRNGVTNPATIDGYSVDVPQMQSVVDPGEVGSESRATTLAGELQRLRYTIQELKGQMNATITRWYQTIPSIQDTIIAGLTASKITAGDMPAIMHLGTGAGVVTVDGSQRQISVYDGNNQQRALLGKIGSGTTDFGLHLLNSSGVIQWSYLTGLTTDGVTANAITETVLFTSSSTVTTGATEVSIGSIAFPSLTTGDQVILIGTTTAAPTNSQLFMRLRQDSTFGTLVNATQIAGPSSMSTTGVLLGVYNVLTNLTNKAFFATIVDVGAGTGVSASTTTLLGIRRKR